MRRSDNPRIVTPGDIDTLREAYRMLNEEQAIKRDTLADDFVLEQTEALLDTRGTFRGADGLEASFRELREGFGEIRFEPKDFQIRGDWVIVPVHFSASVRGMEQEAEIVHIWQMRDGLATRMRVVGAGGDPERELERLRDKG
jgi:ketosteroid isomerase-like protein